MWERRPGWGGYSSEYPNQGRVGNFFYSEIFCGVMVLWGGSLSGLWEKGCARTPLTTPQWEIAVGIVYSGRYDAVVTSKR